MKRLLTLCTLLLAVTISATAQNTIAKIKYEEAEEAFARQDFKTTIERLDEAKKLLKSTNPKILHLRILAAQNLIKGEPDFDYGLIEQFKKDAKYYLEQYENSDEDKYREVYKASEFVSKKYPDRQAYDRIVAERSAADARLQQAKQDTAKAKAYAATLMKRFQYIPHTSLSKLTEQNSYAAKLANTRIESYNGSYWYSAIKGLGNPYPEGALTIGLKGSYHSMVSGYTYCIKSNKNAVEVTGTYKELATEILANVPRTFVTKQTSDAVEFKDPATGITILASIYNYNKWMAATIAFSEP